MSSASGHPSSSATQSAAEKEIVAALAGALSVELETTRDVTSISLAGGVRIEVDAATRDASVVVEAYARQGRLKSAQLKKIAQDILKLALLKREPGRQSTAAIIVFASQEARDSVSGWVGQAADSFDVTLKVVDIPENLREQIRLAQSRQVMVNLDQVADDVGLNE